MQAGLLSHLGSTIVILLLPEKTPSEDSMTRLNPLLHLQGEAYRLMTTHIVAMPRTKRGPYIGSLADQRSVIVKAVGFLLPGF